MLIYNEFWKKCCVIFKKFLLLHWTFLSFKSINSSCLSRKKYGAFCIRLLGNYGFISYSWYNLLGIAIKTVLYKSPPLHIYYKNSKYTICDAGYRRDVSLSMRGWKEIIREKTMRQKNVKQQERTKSYSLRCCCKLKVIIIET